MKNRSVVDICIGDTGKGKICDLFADDATHVVRYNGGPNSGHQIFVNNVKTVVHTIPSGILHENIVNVIASGVLVDPLKLIGEIKGLLNSDVKITPKNLKIAANCHVIHKLHIAQDIFQEENAKVKIGTTKCGIGPASLSKYGRTGIRLLDLLDMNKLYDLLTYGAFNVLVGKYNFYQLSYDDFMKELYEAGQFLKPFLTDVSRYMTETLKNENNSVVFEGAQGALLDISHGAYPFITTSYCLASFAATSCGINPRHLGEIVGNFKCYDTRVGAGYFPCKMESDIEDYVVEKGNERGSTTGRRRHCGWLDLVALKYGAMINGIDVGSITKLDIFSSLKEIKVCTSYTIDGETVSEMPLDQSILSRAIPNYAIFEGWSEDISAIEKYEDLPENTKIFISFIDQNLDVPIRYISVGPNRKQTIKVY